jgi:agmatinase
MVYFDAHPDFVSTRRNYYGSVFTDILQYIDLSSSVQIGIRTPEKEEIENLNKHKIKVITPFEIMENGVKKVSEDILSLLGEHTYISFDMDCIDPAYAPGVSVPVPLGLRSVEATYILKKIVEHGMVAMDLMEVCPPYDIKDRTSHLASRIVGETISALG